MHQTYYLKCSGGTATLKKHTTTPQAHSQTEKNPENSQLL